MNSIGQATREAPATSRTPRESLIDEPAMQHGEVDR